MKSLNCFESIKTKGKYLSVAEMSFVLQTVAGILRGNGSPVHSVVGSIPGISGGGGASSSSSCSCHKHPNRCCHKADLLAARNSFSNSSFECMNDDLND